MKSPIYKTKNPENALLKIKFYILMQIKVWFLKIPTVTRDWFKLTGIFKTKKIPNEQTTAQKQLQRPQNAVSGRPSKVITATPDQTRAHQVNTAQSTNTIPYKEYRNDCIKSRYVTIRDKSINKIAKQTDIKNNP